MKKWKGWIPQVNSVLQRDLLILKNWGALPRSKRRSLVDHPEKGHIGIAKTIFIHQAFF